MNKDTAGILSAVSLLGTHMKITGISAQKKDVNRINIMVDGTYRFSLDIYQYADLGLKVGQEYTEEELDSLETESQFGKVYTRALEYSLLRPHSAKEIRDYLYKKTRDTKMKTGAIKKGIDSSITARVFDRLQEKGYIDDEKFTQYWVEARRIKKGVSQRALHAELRAKGVESSIISRFLTESPRREQDELQKVIEKKRHRYPDDQKFMLYLARQGFSFDDIKEALAAMSEIE